MDLTGEYVLPVPRERVWAALLDTDLLRAAIPGCEAITDEGQGAYSAVVVASVGPVKARFKGRIQQHDLTPPSRYSMTFEGDGGLAGFARGSADIELSEAGEAGAHTRLVYRARSEIGGRLAQIGSRLIDATATRLSAQFFEGLTRLLTTPQASAQAAASTDDQRPASAKTVAAPPAVAVSTSGALVSIQMPAWTWAFTATVVALLAAWFHVR
jgi:uncharacterized protein